MQCPKCHQPLDDAEDQYICCAGSSLEWRCAQCAKVSEGFAFPYGHCPHCGGRLEPLATRQLDDAAAIDGIRTAFEIELGGHAFYRKAASEAGDPYLRQLFSKFAAMEEEHMATLSRRYHTRPPTPSPGFHIGLAALYAGIDSRPEDPANLFRIAIAFERRAAEFFDQRAAAATPNSVEHQLYRELAAEEREHATMLKTEYERLLSGKPGLL